MTVAEQNYRLTPEEVTQTVIISTSVHVIRGAVWSVTILCQLVD